MQAIEKYLSEYCTDPNARVVVTSMWAKGRYTYFASVESEGEVVITCVHPYTQMQTAVYHLDRACAEHILYLHTLAEAQ